MPPRAQMMKRFRRITRSRLEEQNKDAKGASNARLGCCRCLHFSSCDGAFFFPSPVCSPSSFDNPRNKKQIVSANLIAKEDIVNLERGCVCCSLRSDLVDAFKELDRRSSSGGGTKFDNVLVETTGVADPGPVVSFFASAFCLVLFFQSSLGEGARFVSLVGGKRQTGVLRVRQGRRLRG